MYIDHVGYAVKDLDAAVKKFLSLGFCLSGDVTQDIDRGVAIQFLIDKSGGGTRVELVAPLRMTQVTPAQSPVDNWLAKNGNSPYHICCASDDIECDIANLTKNGFMLVQAAKTAPACGGRVVAFLYSTATGLLELVESKKI